MWAPSGATECTSGPANLAGPEGALRHPQTVPLASARWTFAAVPPDLDIQATAAQKPRGPTESRVQDSECSGRRFRTTPISSAYAPIYPAGTASESGSPGPPAYLDRARGCSSVLPKRPAAARSVREA
ncbi:hypothetical protein AAY473_035683 [Plecturocebus cupreus]